MTLAELRARLEAIVAKQKQMLAGAGDEDLSEENQSEFDELSAEFDTVSAKIKRLERLEANTAALSQGNGRITPAPAAPSAEITGGGPVIEQDPMRGFVDAADFGLAVAAACAPHGVVDERLNILGAPTNFHQESGEDGFMVPPAMRTEIWDLVMQLDDADVNLLEVVDPEPTGSNQVAFIADESTPWGATGIQASWAAEGSQMSPSRLETKGKQIRLNKLFAFVSATEELLEDAPLIASRLTRGAAAAIRWKASDAIVYGTGAGQPLGWFNADALISIAKESGQAADTIVAENVAKMLSRVIGVGATFWLANSDTLPQLMVMVIGNQPIWTPPNSGFAQAPGGFLLGRPIRFSEHAKTVGDKGDIHLVNPRGYFAANKEGGIKFASSIHLYFDYDVSAFRWTFRLAGQPFLSGPMATPNAATKSHFVVLDARA